MQLVTQTARIAGATPRCQAVPEPGLGRGIDGVFGDLGEPTLLLTKIRIPRACGEPVRRERLEGLTRQIKQRVLTLVTAPPGCGKTTLARHWAEQLIEQEARVAWFSIDADDNDPQRFLRYLCLALASTGFARLAPVGRGGGIDARRSPDEMLSTLINEVAGARDEVFIVLDNYSWITDRNIHDQVSRALDNAPPNLHIVILSSAPPPLPIGLLRARNQLLELSSADLRFDEAETQELLRQAGADNVPPARLREIYRYTQGWPAAVRIMASTMDKRAKPSTTGRDALDSRTVDAVNDYLDELFVQLPAVLVDAMIDTSLVDAVSPALYQALADGQDTETFFRQLRQQQILTPLGPDRELFAYPAPLRRYLRKRLAAKGPRHIGLLHQRACTWFAQHDRWDNAIDHALDAGEVETALRWMACHAMSLLKAGHLASLIRWHQRSPAFSTPLPLGVQLAFAWAHAITHSLPAAIELVATILAHEEPAPASALRAECNAILAVAHAAADRIDRAAELSARCLGHPFADAWISNVIASIDLYCRFRTGRWASFFAEPTDLKAQGEGETNTHILRLSILGLGKLLRGPLDQAEKYAGEASRISPALGEKDVLRFSAWPAGLLAMVYYEGGRFGELEALLRERLADIVSSGYLDCTMGAFLSAGRAAIRQGKPAEALAVLEQGERIAADRKWTRFEASVLLERLRLHLSEDRLAESEGCVQRLAQLARGAGVDDATPICTVAQLLELAKAYFAIHTGKATEAIPSLRALLEQFSTNGNELFAVRVGTLLSIAYRQAGDRAIAETTFLETAARAEKGGFVSAIIDQGPEVGRLLSELCAALEKRPNAPRLLAYASRLLQDWRLAFDEQPAKEMNTAKKETAECALTPKEREVLSLMASGRSNKEIARSLCVTPETVKTHLKRIFLKLSVDRRIHAISKAESLGLLTR